MIDCRRAEVAARARTRFTKTAEGPLLPKVAHACGAAHAVHLSFAGWAVSGQRRREFESRKLALAGRCAEISTSGESSPQPSDLPKRKPKDWSPQHRLTSAEVVRLVAARNAGAEINDLVAQFGIHRATVINHLGRAKAPKRRAQGRTLTEVQIQQAGRLYVSGRSLLKVGGDLQRRQAAPAQGPASGRF